MADVLLRLPLPSPLANSSSRFFLPPPLIPAHFPRLNLSSKPSSDSTHHHHHHHHHHQQQIKRFPNLKVRAVVAEGDGPKWWEKNAGPNMVDIHSTQDFLRELSRAGDKLVVVEFYGTWCGSCRALFPKLCKTAEENPDILFLKVNFDENKPMCKRLNVRVLPFFHFYRGADGLLDSFSCSLAKGHTKHVDSVCWNPSGEYVASVSEDSVRVWSLGSGSEGECVHELNCNGNKFHSCVFHPTHPSLLSSFFRENKCIPQFIL